MLSTKKTFLMPGFHLNYQQRLTLPYCFKHTFKNCSPNAHSPLKKPLLIFRDYSTMASTSKSICRKYCEKVILFIQFWATQGAPEVTPFAERLGTSAIWERIAWVDSWHGGQAMRWGAVRAWETWLPSFELGTGKPILNSAETHTKRFALSILICLLIIKI